MLLFSTNKLFNKTKKLRLRRALVVPTRTLRRILAVPTRTLQWTAKRVLLPTLPFPPHNRIPLMFHVAKTKLLSLLLHHIARVTINVEKRMRKLPLCQKLAANAIEVNLRKVRFLRLLHTRWILRRLQYQIAKTVLARRLLLTNLSASRFLVFLSSHLTQKPAKVAQ